jgi:fatty-acyl-CoA synthase
MLERQAAGVSPTPVYDIRAHARAAPERTAIVFRGERMSYAKLERLANRLAHLLRESGLARGDHFAALLPNGTLMLALPWAAWRTGTYFTPISTALTAAEVRYLVDDCDARLVIAEASLGDVVRALPQQLERRLRWLAHGGAIEGFEALEPLVAAASPEPANAEPPGSLMLYTSGTTGAPKGVYRPLLPAEHRGTPPFAGDLVEVFGLAGEHVRYLSPGPLYHAAPLRFSLATLAGGGTVVVMPRFDAAGALALLQAERITVSQWVPVMFSRMLALPEVERAAFAAPAHTMAIHAAAPCPVPLKRRMIEWWGPILMEYYAGSEGVGMTTIDSADWLQHPGSVGRQRRGELHIVGADGAELSAGQAGLVTFSGMPAFEYYKAPEKTAQRRTREGWLTLGDVGYVDAEGYLFLTDRLDDMLISGGVNVYPQEIEAAIALVPGVAECAVVGVADERFGERPVAFIVPTDRDADAADLIAEVQRRCEATLGRIKRPDRFIVRTELPRLPTGKLLRRQLREELRAGAAGPAP